MEDFNIENIPIFEDVGLNEILCKIKQTFQKGQQNFVDLIVGMHDLRERFTYDYHRQSLTQQWSYRASDKILYTFPYLISKLGFTERQVNKLLQCYEKFIEVSAVDGRKLLSAFYGYTSSKLFELLPVSKETLLQAIDKKLIKPSMTQKELRLWVKSLNINAKNKEIVVDFDNQEEIKEEEIPMVYDPTKYYDFDYFKSKSKNQLVNMIWSLQKEFQKSNSKKR